MRSLSVALSLCSSVVLSACVAEQGAPAPEDMHDVAEFSAGGDRLEEVLGAPDAEGWRRGPVLEADGAFDRIGVMFDAATPIELEVRTSLDGGLTFGAWVPANIVWNEASAYNAAADVDEGTHIGTRFRAPVEANLSFVRLFAFEKFERPDVSELDVEGAGEQEQALARDTLDVVSRVAWGARAPACGYGNHTPNRLTIHHTEQPGTVDPAVRVRQAQSLHIDVRNWCDIGYHLLIGYDGRIFQGRLENKLGSHAGPGNNTNNVGISFIGSFMDELPTPAALDAGAAAMRTVADEWGIPLNRTKVKGHREVRTTDCPGDTLYDYLEELIALADGGEPPAPPPAPGCTSSTLGAAVASGDCVQVSYEACGLDTCAWYRCSAGSWVCTDLSDCEETNYDHAQCDSGSDDDVEPDDGVIGPIVDFPYTHQSSTAPSTRDLFDDYSCDRSKSESGPEVVYEVTLPSSGVLTAMVTDGANIDVDVHILSALNDSACLDRHDSEASAAVDAGTAFVVVDTYRSAFYGERPGAYTVVIDFDADGAGDLPPVGTGSCAMQSTDQEMFWSSCASSMDGCFSSGGRRYLALPATGPAVKEAHLVTTADGFGSGWPSSFTQGISAHYALSASTSGYDMSRTESWAPAGEGGSQYGQGSTGNKIPVVDEAWYITMYWKQRPAGGTRMIVTNPANGRSVVASAGWETGPGANTSLAGVTEEIHHYLGTTHLSDLTVGFAVDQDLPLGPIVCGGAPDPEPEPTDPEPEPIDLPDEGSYDDIDSDHEDHAAIEQLRALGALWGCTPGSFCPDAPLTRAELANLIAVLEQAPYDPSDAATFADVGEEHWAHQAVEELSARAITYGCGGGNYCPGNEVSRASWAVYIRRARGLNGTSDAPADDVSPSHWAASSIGAVLEAGLMEDCGVGDFCPSDPVTRADAARFAAMTWLD
jgi:hypothetical protein